MKYVALLRGIMPMNPNMKSAKLKEFFEGLGFENVATVIASGNVVFESSSSNSSSLEKKIEQELPKELGFTSTTIIRSEDELKKFVKKDPFKGVKDERPNYLVVTFFKDRTPELATVIDLDKNNGGQFMAKLEKEHGKEITTRTFKTVHRILKVMEK
jgi:uncharacterized protein (DUF1697 family)